MTQKKTGFTLKKALPEDFEHIYPLLLGFNNPRLSKEDWRQLFVNHWNNEDDYFGFALVDEEKNKYAGFMGLIFSTREINGQTRKFANMTSWIIDNAYRRKGLGRKLMDEVMKLKGYTITDFTASPETLSMLEQHGFKELETSVVIIRPTPKPGTLTDMLSPKYSIISNPKKVKGHLNHNELKLYKDHSTFKCFHLAIKEKKTGETCYLVLNRTFRGRYPHAKIHYIGNLDLFAKCIPRVIGKICLRLKIAGVIADKRFLKNHRIENAIHRKLPYISAYKSETLDKSHLNDSLYTEFVVLNL